MEDDAYKTARAEAMQTLAEDPDEMNRRRDDVLDRILREILIPNAKRIATCAALGHVAVAVDSVRSDETTEAARSLGWDGESAVFKLSHKRAKRFADRLRAMADSTTAAWVTRKGGEPRVFLLTGYGSLCLNCGKSGWYIEPGTLDQTSNN